MIDIKKAVKHPVTFEFYRDSQLWYSTVYNELFPVPIEDIGNAKFNSIEKGLLMMRYMRKHNASVESVV